MREERMQVWYFTFGCDPPLSKHMQPVKAPDADAARLKMLDTYGQKWCSQIDGSRFSEYDKKYGPYQLLPEMETTEDEAADIAERMGVER